MSKSIISSPEHGVEVILADLQDERHCEAVLAMTEAYSSDPYGDGKPLDPWVHENLIPGLKGHPTSMVFLAYLGETPVGLATCFRGFSTFAARPLINIHDLCVLPASRGKGVARLILDAVEKKGRELGCCKLTLEVLENNHRALGVYKAAGYAQLEYDNDAGGALFYAKKLK